VGAIARVGTAGAWVLRDLKVGFVDSWQMLSRKMQKILLGLLLVGVVVIGYSIWGFGSSGRSRAEETIAPTPEEAMIAPTLEWGRLAPFPTSAKNFSIRTEGSSSSRSFGASFTAPAVDVERWLRESPGTRDVTPKRDSNGLPHYRISPGGGAAHAEVTVENGTSVKIYVYLELNPDRRPSIPATIR
jgi:hypothetical protein